ncbi:MAG: disulfide bond formation protein B [Alphaproteobacteria bacterium]|nr:disulfide bond formation protein B [Alphaproteobacteria bacterium]
MHSLITSPRVLPWFLLCGGAGPLLFALFVQYGLHLPPCHYCVLQRYPYALPLLAGLASFTPFGRRRMGLLVALAVLGWVSTMGIALWHVGIEQGIIIEAGGCSSGALSGSVEALREQILGAPLVACNQASAVFMGISMAAWNAMGALGLCFIAAYLWRKRIRV